MGRSSCRAFLLSVVGRTDGHGDRFRFGATQREMIVTNANVDRVAEGSGLYDADGRTWDHAHLHQPETVSVGRGHGGNTSRNILWDHIEGHKLSPESLLPKLKVIFNFTGD